jgi:Antidote-toxin recognition MazE, bacterial antitoxin
MVNPDQPDNSDKREIEIRRAQALTGDRSLTVVLPKQFATQLGISKGDFLKCCVENHRLILEKAII